MAPPVRAEVALTSLQNCLVNLPPGLIALISNTNIVSYICRDRLSAAYHLKAGPECGCGITISVTNSVFWCCVKW